MFHCLFWRTKIKYDSAKADTLKKRKKKHLTRHLGYMNFHCSSKKGFNMSQRGNKEIQPDLQAHVLRFKHLDMTVHKKVDEPEETRRLRPSLNRT